MSKNDVAILGAGMHEWGKWGRNFAEYGVAAIKEAMADAGLEWNQVDFIVGGDTAAVRRMGFQPASTLQDALEMATDVVGPQPTITHLKNPPILMADVT